MIWLGYELIFINLFDICNHNLLLQRLNVDTMWRTFNRRSLELLVWSMSPWLNLSLIEVAKIMYFNYVIYIRNTNLTNVIAEYFKLSSIIISGSFQMNLFGDTIIILSWYGAYYYNSIMIWNCCWYPALFIFYKSNISSTP